MLLVSHTWFREHGTLLYIFGNPLYGDFLYSHFLKWYILAPCEQIKMNKWKWSVHIKLVLGSLQCVCEKQYWKLAKTNFTRYSIFHYLWLVTLTK